MNLRDVLPKYQSHKIVQAAKILRVMSNPAGGGWILTLEGGVEHTVPDAWFDKFMPGAGKYFVLYDDDYASISPAQAFEDGYTPVRA